jgi:hypothetical protein
MWVAAVVRFNTPSAADSGGSQRARRGGSDMQLCTRGPAGGVAGRTA